MAKFRTELNALNAKGEVYRHYRGGIYRKLHEAKHTETGETLVIYEHLWPHEHTIYARPITEFYSTVKITDGVCMRFQRVVKTLEIK